MITIFEQNILKNQCRYQISDITDISTKSQKKDKAYFVEKKVISDHLCSFDDLKFHFRMLYSFIFFIINIYSQKTKKTEKNQLHIGKKCENMLISVISDIRYQEAIL